MMSFEFAVIALAALSGFAQGESCYCTEHYDPVCASNGKVFSNLCMLKCHNLNTHDNLQVAESDRCTQHQMLAALPPFLSAKSNCFRRCPHTPLPVCGSDGVTYGSSCALNCVKEIHNDKQGVVEVHSGSCNSKSLALQQLSELQLSCFRLCPHTYVPVCGSDGVTYGSFCAMSCVKKINNAKKDVMKVHDGACSSKVQTQVAVEQDKAETSEVCLCTDEFKPVCGSNLHTYSNMCVFECDAKKNSALKLMRRGRCIIMP